MPITECGRFSIVGMMLRALLPARAALTVSPVPMSPDAWPLGCPGAVDPAMMEVNDLGEFGCKVEPICTGRKVTAVHLTWWPTNPDKRIRAASPSLCSDATAWTSRLLSSRG
ncbi:MAG: hypothetical protein J2P48_05240 [Alphaproteobacteria bacterium]|nr:hypothetical protein [Alphaproteobacteria bacterium]